MTRLEGAVDRVPCREAWILCAKLIKVMGQETFYCFHCQVRLTGAEFKEAKGLRYGNRVACGSCIPQLMALLTPQ